MTERTAMTDLVKRLRDHVIVNEWAANPSLQTACELMGEAADALESSGELPEEPYCLQYCRSVDREPYVRTLAAAYDTLRASHLALAARLRESDRMATMRHSTIAEGVFETVRDGAATWDRASDELIWHDPEIDISTQKHRKVSDKHLADCCVRFPQWADDLRSFAQQWNSEEPLTDEMLDAVEVKDEEVERGTHRAMQILRFYNKLHATEKRAEQAESRIAIAEEELRQYKADNGIFGAGA